MDRAGGGLTAVAGRECRTVHPQTVHETRHDTLTIYAALSPKLVVTNPGTGPALTNRSFPRPITKWGRYLTTFRTRSQK